jgi:AmpD protein
MTSGAVVKLLPKKCYSRRHMLAHKGVVIHYISAVNIDPDNWDSTEAAYNLLKNVGFSAHYLIGRDGETLQMVPLSRRAYHAGVSSYGGMKNLNNYFFGIELVATHTSGFTDLQYNSLQTLCAFLIYKYTISTDYIVGHSDVVENGRKIDPGPLFDWHRFHAGLRAF